MSGSALRSMVDGFFIVNPHRTYFVFPDSDAPEGVDTFLVITRGIDVVAFDRIPTENCVPAAVLADWFSDTDEGQETIKKMVAGMDEEQRRGDEVQERGELALMPTWPTSH